MASQTLAPSLPQKTPSKKRRHADPVGTPCECNGTAGSPAESQGTVPGSLPLDVVHPTFRCTCVRRGKHAYKSPFVEAVAGERVAEHMGWTGDMTGFDVEIYLHVVAESVWLGVSLTHRQHHSMHKRDYIKEHVATTLKASYPLFAPTHCDKRTVRLRLDTNLPLDIISITCKFCSHPIHYFIIIFCALPINSSIYPPCFISSLAFTLCHSIRPFYTPRCQCSNTTIHTELRQHLELLTPISHEVGRTALRTHFHLA